MGHMQVKMNHIANQFSGLLLMLVFKVYFFITLTINMPLRVISEQFWEIFCLFGLKIIFCTTTALSMVTKDDI